MANPFTLPVLGVLTLAGTGIGMLLGNSAIAEIDPIHYGGAASTSFHADLVPNRPSRDAPDAPIYAAAFEGYGDGCINCVPYPEEYFPVPDPAFEAQLAGYAAPEQPEFEAAFDAIESQIDKADAVEPISDIERYAYFPITAEDAPAATLSLASTGTSAEKAPATDCAAGEQCAGDPTPGI